MDVNLLYEIHKLSEIISDPEYNNDLFETTIENLPPIENIISGNTPPNERELSPSECKEWEHLNELLQYFNEVDYELDKSTRIVLQEVKVKNGDDIISSISENIDIEVDELKAFSVTETLAVIYEGEVSKGVFVDVEHQISPNMTKSTVTLTPSISHGSRIPQRSRQSTPVHLQSSSSATSTTSPTSATLISISPISTISHVTRAISPVNVLNTPPPPPPPHRTQQSSIPVPVNKAISKLPRAKVSPQVTQSPPVLPSKAEALSRNEDYSAVTTQLPASSSMSPTQHVLMHSPQQQQHHQQSQHATPPLSVSSSPKSQTVPRKMTAAQQHLMTPSPRPRSSLPRPTPRMAVTPILPITPVIPATPLTPATPISHATPIYSSSSVPSSGIRSPFGNSTTPARSRITVVSSSLSSSMSRLSLPTSARSSSIPARQTVSPGALQHGVGNTTTSRSSPTLVSTIQHVPSPEASVRAVSSRTPFRPTQQQTVPLRSSQIVNRTLASSTLPRRSAFGGGFVTTTSKPTKISSVQAPSVTVQQQSTHTEEGQTLSPVVAAAAASVDVRSSSRSPPSSRPSLSPSKPISTSLSPSSPVQNNNSTASSKIVSSPNTSPPGMLMMMTGSSFPHRQASTDSAATFTTMGFFSADYSVPPDANAVLHANQDVLWLIFTSYCSTLYSQGATALDMLSNRDTPLATLDDIWTLLRDFDVCPSMCSKHRLYLYIHDICVSLNPSEGNNNNNNTNTNIQSSQPLERHFMSPAKSTSHSMSRIPVSVSMSSVLESSPVRIVRKSVGRAFASPLSKNELLTFTGFFAVLWKISSESVGQDTISSLLFRMENSNGRSKIVAKNSRGIGSSKTAPQFHLKRSDMGTSSGSGLGSPFLFKKKSASTSMYSPEREDYMQAADV